MNMRITALLLLSLLSASAFASVEAQQPYEEASRALQQAKRVAIMEAFPNRAFLLGQRVAQNAKSFDVQELKIELKQQKKSRKSQAKL
jgi:hypothetical protein